MNKYLLGLLVVLGVFSCERVLIQDIPDTTPTATFEHLWEEIRQRYSFFEFRNLDWDQVYDTYAPLINDDMSDNQLFNVLEDMIYELEDGHSSLFTDSKSTNYYQLYVENFPQPFDPLIVNQYINVPKNIDNFRWALINDNFTNGKEVVYIRYPSFAGRLTEEILDEMVQIMNNVEGVVFDIRQNSGGSLGNVHALLERFTDIDVAMFETQFRLGPDPADWGPREMAIVQGNATLKVTTPFVVLTDRGSYSSSSYFTLGAKYFDNIRVVGDTTAGGLGMYAGGTLPNGWRYRCSISRSIAVDENGEEQNYENGVPPDVWIVNDEATLENNQDIMLERAIEELNL